MEERKKTEILPCLLKSFGLVWEPLTGFLPAAGSAPLVPALHAVHFPALFGLAAALPKEKMKKLKKNYIKYLFLLDLNFKYDFCCVMLN